MVFNNESDLQEVFDCRGHLRRNDSLNARQTCSKETVFVGATSAAGTHHKRYSACTLQYISTGWYQSTCAATTAQTKGNAAGLQHHRQLLGPEAEAITCRRGVAFSRCFRPWHTMQTLASQKTTLMPCLGGTHEQGWHYAAP